MISEELSHNTLAYCVHQKMKWSNFTKLVYKNMIHKKFGLIIFASHV